MNFYIFSLEKESRKGDNITIRRYHVLDLLCTDILQQEKDTPRVRVTGVKVKYLIY